MISGRLDLIAPAMEQLAQRYNGWAFHSCGDWSGRVESIKAAPGLRMVDVDRRNVLPRGR